MSSPFVSRPPPSTRGQLGGPHGHVAWEPLLGRRGLHDQRPAFPPAARHQRRHHQRGAHRPASELPQRVQRRHCHFQQVHFNTFFFFRDSSQHAVSNTSHTVFRFSDMKVESRGALVSHLNSWCKCLSSGFDISSAICASVLTSVTCRKGQKVRRRSQFLLICGTD